MTTLTGILHINDMIWTKEDFQRKFWVGGECWNIDDRGEEYFKTSNFELVVVKTELSSQKYMASSMHIACLTKILTAS